jgi:SAM-dependent methyltransferase
MGRTDRLRRAAQPLRRRLIALEKRRFIVGPGSISSTDHTVDDNRTIWQRWDWSEHGDEWTEDVRAFRGVDPEAWKATLIQEVMLGYAPPGGTFLEIGPGGGRWTQTLEGRAGRLILADIASVCLDLCRERFRDRSHIEYIVTDGRSLPGVDDRSVDFIWSYDVFVHINPTDTDRYLGEFARVLKPGAHATIHHAGTYVDDQEARGRFRSHIDAAFFAHLTARNGLTVVRQDRSLAHFPGDVVSVIRKP